MDDEEDKRRPASNKYRQATPIISLAPQALFHNCPPSHVAAPTTASIVVATYNNSTEQHPRRRKTGLQGQQHKRRNFFRLVGYHDDESFWGN